MIQKSYHPLYKTWAGMHDRCKNPKNTSYKNYGARGILVCNRWESFDLFTLDMGIKPKGMTLERINNDGNYEPDNCTWATPTEQLANRRNSHNPIDSVMLRN